MNQTHRNRLIDKPKEELVRVIIALDDQIEERVLRRIGTKIKKLTQKIDAQKLHIESLNIAIRKRDERINRLKGDKK